MVASWDDERFAQLVIGGDIFRESAGAVRHAHFCYLKFVRNASCQYTWRVHCDSQPGIMIHDDGSSENGYSGNPATIATFNAVEKFTPASYPSTFTSVCVAFQNQAGTPTTLNYSVIVYAADGPGGWPGTQSGALPMWLLAFLQEWGRRYGGPAPIFSAGITVTSGSVYIGVRYTPLTANVFTAADESTTNPVGFAGGYVRFDPTSGGTGAWGTTDFVPGLPLALRARGGDSNGWQSTCSDASFSQRWRDVNVSANIQLVAK